jgi:hypothetical protein
MWELWSAGCSVVCVVMRRYVRVVQYCAVLYIVATVGRRSGLSASTALLVICCSCTLRCDVCVMVLTARRGDAGELPQCGGRQGLTGTFRRPSCKPLTADPSPGTLRCGRTRTFLIRRAIDARYDVSAMLVRVRARVRHPQIGSDAAGDPHPDLIFKSLG